MTYLERHVSSRLSEYLDVFRVVQIAGARQVGKTTIAQHTAGDRRFVSLDDPATRARCSDDPVGFLRSFGDGDVLIDEVQRVPDLLLAIKREVDIDQRAGRYLITGSSEPWSAVGSRDSLAGRLGSITLRPLSQGEISGHLEQFLPRLMGSEDPSWNSVPERGFADYVERIMVGGYPQALSLRADRRGIWLRSYIDNVLSRDVREMVNVEDIGRLRRVFHIIASGSGQLLRKSSIARDAELAKATASTWVGLLESTHLIDVIPGWGGSHRARMVRMPKVYINDTGLLAAALRVDADRITSTPQLAGACTETFVVQEILRQSAFHAECSPTISHYRDRDQREIDVIVESDDGSVSAVEVKSSASVSAQDARHIEALANRLGDRFRRGVVIYTGEHPLPLTARVTAVPLANVWQ